MHKIRVHELAKELGTTSKKLIDVLAEMKVPIKNHMSSIEDDVARKLVTALTDKKEKPGQALKDKKQAVAPEIAVGEKLDKKSEKKTGGVKEKKTGAAQTADTGEHSGRKARKYIQDKLKEDAQKQARKEIVLEGRVTVCELAAKLELTASHILTILLDIGVVANINQALNDETIKLLAGEFDVDVKIKEDPHEEMLKEMEDSIKGEETTRFPVVAILGHVDHGKTSLLDYIRNSNVTEKEAGGITQHIGAYQVSAGDKGVVFLDTPGHEAFTAMRARGAQATDIAVLVVSADDGVMPQTIEAINHIKAAGVNIIVAINKIDRPNANVERVKQQLAEHELVPEDWGGDVICAPISALRGDGIDDLLEMILLLAEINEYKTSPNRLAQGVVIEAKLDKGRGPVATVLIQDGTLHISQPIICGTVYGKVRAMINDRGENIKSADSSTPVEIIGLSDVPQAGDRLQAVNDEKFARQLAGKRARKLKEVSRQTVPVSFEELFQQIQDNDIKELNIILKGDVQGSVEALKSSLEKLEHEEVKIKIIHSGVGAVNESDVMLAAASRALIIGFNVRPDIKARKLAEAERINIRTYRVIYEAIEDVRAAVTGMISPKYEEVIHGAAQVRQVFKASRIGTIAGSYVVDGKIVRNNQVRVIRDGHTVYEGKIDSLKRFKEDIKEVLSGFECGILLENYNDIKEGDLLEAFSIEEVKTADK